MEINELEKWMLLRKRKGISQVKIANGLETDQSNLSKCELGKREFPDYLWEKYTNYIEEN
ncbi:hypothetical protein [Virgibacillus sp. CBA3643]|uniref:hypothetical protein n=1 Tax=Virgibacillus sp. CBA3643 TaxID=2942278 RepID=UPI0035A28C46